MSEGIEAQLKASTAAHAEAIARTRALHEAAARARQEAAEAASMGQLLLAQTAAGESDLDEDRLLAASEQARVAQAKSDIAQAVHASALRQQNVAQIGMLKAQADALQTDYDNAVSRLIEYGDVVDSCLSDLQTALEAYNEQQRAVQAAYSACHTHNAHTISPGNNPGNPLLRDLTSDKQPRVERIPQRIGLMKLKAGLFVRTGDNNFDDRLTKAQVHALAPRTRMDFNRPVGA